MFSQPGIYQLSINAMSPSINGSGGRVCQNDVKTKTICVEGPPIPKFELDKLAGCAPFIPEISELSDISKSCKIFRKWEVFFNNNPCGVQSGNYEFIDGTNSASLVPKIKFNSRGNYKIRLKLANTCDTVIFDKQLKVLGLPSANIPSIDSICKNGSINPTVTVTACDNTISDCSWS